MTIDTRILSIARVVLATIRKREAEYEAEVANWYESGDGRPVDQGGRGYIYPYCPHGARMWVDHDIPCGACEMGDDRPTRRAVQEAAAAVAESDRRLAWLNARPREMGYATASPVPLPGDTGERLALWVFEPITDLMPNIEPVFV